MALEDLILECVDNYINNTDSIVRDVSTKLKEGSYLSTSNPMISSKSVLEIMEKYKVSKDGFKATLAYGAVIIEPEIGTFDLQKAYEALLPVAGQYGLTLRKKGLFRRKLEIYEDGWKDKFLGNFGKALDDFETKTTELINSGTVPEDTAPQVQLLPGLMWLVEALKNRDESSEHLEVPVHLEVTPHYITVIAQSNSLKNPETRRQKMSKSLELLRAIEISYSSS